MAKRPVGRPTKYTKELIAKILTQIADGKSIRAVCAPDDMPDKSTLFKWLLENKEFSDQYARAKDEQADLYFEESLEIADAATPEQVAVARLRIDTRKWAAGKLRPKKYGDKLDVDMKASFNVTIDGDDAKL